MINRPYKEESINENECIRTFDSNVSQAELEWHVDKEDRLIEIIENDGDWQFQIDNKLPITLDIAAEYYIPKETYHRILKGSGKLKVKIKKLR
jgi:hypothetical protein